MSTTVGGEAIDAAGLWRRAAGLLLFDGLRRGSPLRELVGVLAALAPGGVDPAGAYGALFRALADSPAALAPAAGDTLSGDTLSGDTLRGALVDALLLDENPLSRAAWRSTSMAGGVAGLPPALLAAATSDLRTLQALAEAGPALPVAVARAAPLSAVPPWWDGVSAGERREGRVSVGAINARARQRLARRLAGSEDWGALALELADHYAIHGSGPFARYRAFRWVGPPATVPPAALAPVTGEWAPPAGQQNGASLDGMSLDGASSPALAAGSPVWAGALRWLVPVPFPDAVRPTDLIGYTEERALLRRNTVQFLAGYPANNVLLYGDRGTGKSSSVKALLNEEVSSQEPAPGESPGGPSGEGAVDWGALRLIEVPKARLADFPAIVALLRGRPQRFILFVDDLSFEEGETQYKDMKAMLEGGIEARPPNVVVYATSNRRHLVREVFADRAPLASEEVHAGDTVQEKLSFADRFGLTITFPTPDQAGYLAIVEGLARQRALPLTPVALRARAIEWAAWHNGRSGRTARQFIDHLVGELGVAAGVSGDSGRQPARGLEPRA